MSHTLRLILLVIFIPIALLVLAALLLQLFLLDKERVLELATAAVRDETGATLTVAGDYSLTVFPTLGLTLDDAAVVRPGQEQPSLRIRSLDIGVQLMPLLSGRVEINSISLDGLTVRIESGAPEPTIDTTGLSDEELDAFYARRRQALTTAGEAVGPEAAMAAPVALNVQRLTVTNARIEQVDTAGKTTAVIELVNLEASGLKLDGSPIPLTAQIAIPGNSPLEVVLDGTLLVDQAGHNIALDDVEAILTGASAQPITVQARGIIDTARQVAELKLSVATGDTHGDGVLRYASFESPRIEANLKLNKLNPALLALAGPEAAANADTVSASGDEPLPLDAIRAIDTRAELAIEELVIDAHRIGDLRASLRIFEGVIMLNSLTGKLHGGTLDMQATLNGKHNTATLDTSGQVDQMDITAALAATEAKPVLTGNVSLGWSLAATGRTSNELVAALTGPVKLTTAQLVLQDISVEHMLCQAVALTNQEKLTASFPDNTSFNALSADIQLADGKARLKPLRAELPQITLTGTGAFDLLSKDFKTTFKARLAPELETLDPACRVSKRLTAIDWPVDCAGNAAGEPAKWCSVDTAEIIEDLGKNEAKRKLQKEAGKLLDKLFK